MVRLNYELEVGSRSGILHVKDDGVRVAWLERHYIILTKVIMRYICRHCKVAIVDLFGSVNVIAL